MANPLAELAHRLTSERMDELRRERDELKDLHAKLLKLVDEYRIYVRETVTRGANIAYINVHCPLMAADLAAKDGS